jgi:HlyD family secretion protein
MKRSLLFLVLVLGCTVLGWIARDREILFRLGRPPETAYGEGSAPGTADDVAGVAGSEARGPVALGRLEPAEGVIDISGVAGDRLEKLNVEENAAVRRNDPLAYLDSRALRNLELQAIRSQRREAEARRAAEEELADAKTQAAKLALEQAQAYEWDLKVQKGKLGVLEKNLELAQTAQRRLDELRSTDVASVQDREQQNLAVQKADAEFKAAEISLSKGRLVGGLGVAAANADLATALASRAQIPSLFPVESLKKKEKLAQSQWQRTVIRAPCDGRVVKVFARPGEAIGATPILQIADCRRMVALAEVYETVAKQIRVGQKARIDSEAFPSPYDRKQTGLSGTVSRIGKIVLRAERKKLDPLAQSDCHVIEVRVDLDPESSKVAANLIHLQVDVQFAPLGP